MPASSADLSSPSATALVPRVAGAIAFVLAGTGVALASYVGGRSGAMEASLVAMFGSVLMFLAWLDLRSRTIPNAIVYPAMVLAIAVARAWPDRGLGATLGGGVFALLVMLVAWLMAGRLGGGDVKMASLVGFVVGFPGVMLASAIWAISGGLVAAALLATGRFARSTALPYGPSIALGGVAALLF